MVRAVVCTSSINGRSEWLDASSARSKLPSCVTSASATAAAPLMANEAPMPGVYAAAVAIAAPSNLLTLLNSIPAYWEPIRKQFYECMGDPGTEASRARLKRQSPLNAADKITTPLLVVQGLNDPRVNKAEADQIVVALRERHYPVQYLLAPDEGHGFARPVNNLAMMAAPEKFLAQYLHGRYQESMTPAGPSAWPRLPWTPKPWHWPRRGSCVSKPSKALKREFLCLANY